MRTYKNIVSPTMHEIGKIAKSEIAKNPKLFDELASLTELCPGYFRDVLNGTKHTSVRRMEMLAERLGIIITVSQGTDTKIPVPQQKTLPNIVPGNDLSTLSKSISDTQNRVTALHDAIDLITKRLQDMDELEDRVKQLEDKLSKSNDLVRRYMKITNDALSAIK